LRLGGWGVLQYALTDSSTLGERPKKFIISSCFLLYLFQYPYL